MDFTDSEVVETTTLTKPEANQAKNDTVTDKKGEQTTLFEGENKKEPQPKDAPF